MVSWDITRIPVFLLLLEPITSRTSRVVQVVARLPYSLHLHRSAFSRLSKGAAATLVEVLDMVTFEGYQSHNERWFCRMTRTIEVGEEYFEKI